MSSISTRLKSIKSPSHCILDLSRTGSVDCQEGQQREQAHEAQQVLHRVSDKSKRNKESSPTPLNSNDFFVSTNKSLGKCANCTGPVGPGCPDDGTGHHFKWWPTGSGVGAF
jgi:hypothetical protein